MVHNELHALDLAIIGAYLIAMVLIGLVVVKRSGAWTIIISADAPSGRWF